MNFKYSLLNTAALTSLLLTVTARADLPLSLEGIAPKRNRLELGLSLSYYNRSGTMQNQGESSYFMTPQNTLVEIPGRLQEGKNNSDILYTSH